MSRIVKKYKEHLQLSSEEVTLLIEWYKSEPCLWDVNSSSVCSKETRSQVIEKIRRKIITEFGIECTAEQVKGKLTYLRGYYSRELMKENRSKSMNACGGEFKVYCSQWPFFKDLDSFLRDQITPRSSYMYSPSNGVSGHTDDLVVEMDMADDSSSGFSMFSSEEQTEAPSIKRSRSNVSEPVIVQYGTVEKHVDSEDEDVIFGKYVTSELKKFTNPRERALAKFRIQTLFFEMQFGSQPEQTKSNNCQTGRTEDG